jgi:hypothetical protein
MNADCEGIGAGRHQTQNSGLLFGLELFVPRSNVRLDFNLEFYGNVKHAAF